MMQMLVNIDVDDIAKATDFYCRALGLKVGRRFDSGFVELLGGVAPIYLLENSKGSQPVAGVSQERNYTRHWTPIHVDFIVNDIHAAIRQAQAAGAKLESEIRTHKYGYLALLGDPFGHGFCFIQFVGRGYDEITGT